MWSVSSGLDCSKRIHEASGSGEVVLSPVGGTTGVVSGLCIWAVRWQVIKILEHFNFYKREIKFKKLVRVPSVGCMSSFSRGCSCLCIVFPKGHVFLPGPHPPLCSWYWLCTFSHTNVYSFLTRKQERHTSMFQPCPWNKARHQGGWNAHRRFVSQSILLCVRTLPINSKCNRRHWKAFLSYTLRVQETQDVFCDCRTSGWELLMSSFHISNC